MAETLKSRVAAILQERPELTAAGPAAICRVLGMDPRGHRGAIASVLKQLGVLPVRSRKVEPVELPEPSPDAVMPGMRFGTKLEAFVREYLVDLNPKAAALRAGYSPKGLDQCVSRILRRPDVQAAIRGAVGSSCHKVGISADDVVQELAHIAFSDLRGVVSWGPGGVSLKESAELGDDQAAAVAEVTETTSESGGSRRIKLHDKLAALKLLGQHLGLFAERHEHSGPGGGPIPYAILPPAEVDRQLKELGVDDA